MSQTKNQRPSPSASQHLFRYHAPDAKRVVVTGSFCAWDPERHVLTKHRDGYWEARLSLPHGRHEYRFVVDGTWVNDPTCPDVVPTPFGSTNCVLEI
jgi:1,4-alpha-glucan branching enzyme